MIHTIVSSKNFDTAVHEAVLFLKKGKILAMRTDTIYGFVAKASSTMADKITEIRGKRDLNQKPYLLLMPSVNMVREYADLSSFSKEMLNFMHDLMPGRNTIIFPKKEKVEYPKGNTIAIRVPLKKDNLFFFEVLQNFDQPVIAPSLNEPGQDPMNHPEMILKTFFNKVDAFFDQGEVQSPAPSSLYDFTNWQGKPKKLR
ncbi:MAG: hypothetical protein D6767_05740 [Candidatus Hydrogenedentota bacterium]|nr:MAG: hypothetical protein D6767_05740 [Candidatus Hydrogenedentota bacterium]